MKLNKFITDHDDKTVVMARYTRKGLAELDDQGKELSIGDMCDSAGLKSHPV